MEKKITHQKAINYPAWLQDNGFVLDPFLRKGYDERTYLRFGVENTILKENDVFELYLKSTNSPLPKEGNKK